MGKKQTTSSKRASPTYAGSKASDSGLTALEERLLTVSDVARLLNLSRSGIYYLIQRGDLPSIRLGAHLLRFRPTEILRYLQTHSASARRR